MRVSHELVLATNNTDKYEEFKALLATYPEIKLLPAGKILRNASKLSLVETFPTYLENSMAKARFANHGAHFPCLGDDSGLEVTGLEGKPGARSARFAAPKAGVSQDQANVEKLLTELKGVSKDKRQARFVCTLALVMEGMAIHATGILEGTIAEAPAGSNGFGYDPVFVPQGQNRTFAQMSDEEKNRISHRAVAVQKLMDEVRRKGIVFARP